MKTFGCTNYSYGAIHTYNTYFENSVLVSRVVKVTLIDLKIFHNSMNISYINYSKISVIFS